jgi:prepilin-type N-terminal cleavage/methylation domain-containing protein
MQIIKHIQVLNGSKKHRLNAFTLVELLVALALVVIMLGISALVFKTAVEAHRLSDAAAEISGKLNIITTQLNNDLKGLRRDAEIFAIWRAGDTEENGRLPRFDMMMFYSQGSFETFNSYGYSDHDGNDYTGTLKSNLARITYGLADAGEGTQVVKIQNQAPEKRMLYRNMHVVTNFDAGDIDGSGGDDKIKPYDFTAAAFDADEFKTHNQENEYDEIGPAEWMRIPDSDKRDIWAVLADVEIDIQGLPNSTVTPGTEDTGLIIENNRPETLHNLLCRGIGQFKIQGWYYDQSESLWRWVPEVDPDGDGDFSDSDFETSGPSQLDYSKLPGIIYPAVGLQMDNVPQEQLDPESLVMGNFNNIPGLGRALKFTFTIYDSRGIIPEGKTFTHIVYLDE